MPTTVPLAQPDTPAMPPGHAPAAPQGWMDAAWTQITNNGTVAAVVLTTAAVAALTGALFLTRAIRKFAHSPSRAEKLTGPVMFGGMVWSAEAVWEITGPKGAGLPTGLRIAIFSVLEFMLFVAMLRTGDSMRENGHPGRSGKFAWGIAGLMAVVGFVVGAFLDKNIGVAVFRPVVPLVLTTLWWIGVIGEGDPGQASSWNWTPRNLLIKVGALKPGKQDVKEVQRDHLVQKMTDLYYKVAFVKESDQTSKVKKARARLARLTLDADDEIIREVQRRVARTSWTTAQLLPYKLTDPSTVAGDDLDDAADEAMTTVPVDAVTTRRPSNVQVPPTRRVKAASRTSTSSDARRDDPATQAAWLVVTQGISNQRAADAVGGTSEPSVRRRVNKLRDAIASGEIPDPAKPASGASPAIVTTPIPEPNKPVTAGINGHAKTSEENS